MARAGQEENIFLTRLGLFVYAISETGCGFHFGIRADVHTIGPKGPEGPWPVIGEISMTTKAKQSTLAPNTALVNRDENGNIVITLGGNPEGATTAKGNTSYAATRGWGQAVVIIHPDGTQTPAVLRCSLSSK